MKITPLISQSFNAILSSKVRSILTILGIVIGISSVIALMSLSNGVSNNVSDSFSSLGASNITVNSKSLEDSETETNEEEPRPGGGPMNPLGIDTGNETNMRAMFRPSNDPTLTLADFESIINLDSSLIKLATPEISSQSQVSVNDTTTQIDSKGISPDYFTLNNIEFVSGDSFSVEDITGNANKIILGSDAYTSLFPDGGEVAGTKVIIDDIDYEVIGVLDSAEQSRFQNPNRSIFIPYTTALEALDQDNINTITAQASSEDAVPELKTQIESALLSNRDTDNIDEVDFSLTSSQDILSARSSVTSMFTNMLIAIAAISLVVGGIGIMNIMLVSVSERTSEIGLRNAVGAKTYHIIIQFLIEAVILTAIGGIIGIIFGNFLSQLAANFVTVTPSLTLDSVILAVCVAVGSGIIFGLYPAIKASRLDPVESLRYE